ncbi:MAG: hypothetical protein SV377_01435, partial [Halobacteria archaeon]|nr:hypothetical protein [Halobacteria archaeon]
FVVGVATEIENIGDTDDLYRARISDPTGTFVVYAGQYQPDAMTFFAELETPEFVSVVGKARTYQPDDSDRVYTSIRPEEVSVVDSETRDRWTVETARQTLERIENFKKVLRNGESDPNVQRAIKEYGTDIEYLNELRESVLDVVRSIAGVEETSTASGESEKTKGLETQETKQDSGAETEPEEEVEEDIPEFETEEPDTSDLEAKDTTGTEDTEVSQEELGGETEWEWDEDQREQVKEEFGDEFSTGTEIGSKEETREEMETGTESSQAEISPSEEDIEEGAIEEESEVEEEKEEETSGPDESAESIVMGVIEEEDGDEGVLREDIIRIAAERGLDEEEAEDILENLLMEGMCYPTDGDRIKPL